MHNSRTNRVLADIREDVGARRLMSRAERIQDQWDYITDGFGSTALDDGIYSEGDIAFARKVLSRLV